MAAETERIGRLENRVDTLTEQTSELRGAYDHLATKEDLANLGGELRGELKGIRAGLWIVGALLVITEALARLGV